MLPRWPDKFKMWPDREEMILRVTSVLYIAMILTSVPGAGCVSQPVGQSGPREVVATGDSLGRYVRFGGACSGNMTLRREITDLVDADDAKVRKLVRVLIREFSKTGGISGDVVRQIQGNGTSLEYRIESSLVAKSGTLKSVDTIAFLKPVKDGNLIRRVTGAQARDVGSGAWQREESMSCNLVATRFPGKDLVVYSRGGDEDLDVAERAFTSVQLIQRGPEGAVTVARYIKPSEIMGEVIETSPVFSVERWLP